MELFPLPVPRRPAVQFPLPLIGGMVDSVACPRMLAERQSHPRGTTGSGSTGSETHPQAICRAGPTRCHPDLHHLPNGPRSRYVLVDRTMLTLLSPCVQSWIRDCPHSN